MGALVALGRPLGVVMHQTDQLFQNCQCVTCQFFRQHENGNGSCHRYPPVYAGDASPKENHHWKFPVVNAHSWCGEHRTVDPS